MRFLSEKISRDANKQDGCTGRFWEGRFKAQVLPDQAAILACMQYVDLNPIRAGFAKTLEGCDFTSVQDRIEDLKQAKGEFSVFRAGGAACGHCGADNDSGLRS